MLKVLLAEVGVARAGDREQLGDDGGDAVEVAGPRGAIEHFGHATDRDVGVHAAGIHLLDRRGEDKVGPGSSGERVVGVECARVGRQVLMGAELQGVDEDGDGDDVALRGGSANKRGVAFVKGTHRGNEPDRLALLARRVELLAERFDRVEHPRRRSLEP